MKNSTIPPRAQAPPPQSRSKDQSALHALQAILSGVDPGDLAASGRYQASLAALGKALAKAGTDKDARGRVLETQRVKDKGGLLSKLLAMELDNGQRPNLEEIERQLGKVTWQWPNWIPRGSLTLLAGAPGSGKTVFALYLATAICTGAKWPDGQAGASGGKVIWCESEGGYREIAERAGRFGIPKKAILAPRRAWEEDFRLDDPVHLVELEAAIQAHRPGLVVVDSLTGSHRVDENSPEMQSMLSNLRRIASDHETAVVVIHHTRKKQQGGRQHVDQDEVRGATAIIAACRSLLLVDAPDPDREEIKRLSHVKSNLGLKQSSVGWAWRTGSQGDFLEFMETPRPPRRDAAAAGAEDFLCLELDKGKRPSKELQQAAEEAGHSWETVKKASKRLNIRVVKEGSGPWYWGLPSMSDMS